MPRRKADERRPRRDLAVRLSQKIQACLQRHLQEYGLEAYCDFKFAPWIDPPSVEPTGFEPYDRMQRQAHEQFIGPEIKFYIGVRVPRSDGRVKKVGLPVAIPFFRWTRESEEELLAELLTKVPRAEFWPRLAKMWASFHGRSLEICCQHADVDGEVVGQLADRLPAERLLTGEDLGESGLRHPRILACLGSSNTLRLQ